MNLYELTKLEVEMMESLEEKVDIYDEETGEIIEENFDIIENVEKKVEGYYKIIRNFQGDVESIDNEIKRLKELKDSKNKKVDRLSKAMHNYMVATDKKKIELSIGSFNITKSKKVIITNEDLIPEDFKVYTEVLKISKSDIKKALKTGEVAGAVIEECLNFKIK